MARIAARRPDTTDIPQTFSTLLVDRRALMTPSRTLPIANIASMSVGQTVETRPFIIYIMLAIACAGLGYGALQSEFFGSKGFLNATSLTLWTLATMLAALAAKPRDRKDYLFVTSNDGGVTRFAAAERAILDQALQLLTEKINSGDQTRSFAINFETGTIDALAPGSGSPPPRPAPNGRVGQPAQSASSMTERLERAAPAHRPAASAQNQPHKQNGSHHEQNTAYVDFSTLLPPVVEMHRFYARQPNVEHLEQRLSELELLMRSGAQTPGQKSRVVELTNDLAEILKSYPPAAQIFQNIAGLVSN